jgi:hypothetical protein
VRTANDFPLEQGGVCVQDPCSKQRRHPALDGVAQHVTFVVRGQAGDADVVGVPEPSAAISTATSNRPNVGATGRDFDQEPAAGSLRLKASAIAW